MHSPPRFHGIIPPLVTPLLSDDALDCAGLERLLEHVLAGGVHGVFLLGTCGEGPAVGYRLREELVRRTTKQVAGRVSVLVGISETSHVEQLRFAEKCAALGATALVMSPPYYFPLSEDEVSRSIDFVAPRLPLPVLLYNLPSHTKVPLTEPIVRRATQHANIAGIKDSAGDLEGFRALVKLKRERPDWSVLMGPEELLADALLAGGDGGVNGGANVFPQLYVGVYDAWRSSDRVEMRRRQTIIQDLAARLYHVSPSPNGVILGLKAALASLGIASGHPATPLAALAGSELDAVAAAIRRVQTAL
jgi:4-hydroxy-tetrahydrodipicolinate synthase